MIIMTYALLILASVVLRTNIKGKAPVTAVIMKLIDNGTMPSSKSLMTDTIIARNMNNAFTSNAIPAVLDIALKSII